jgi:hypothetical protein
MMNEMRKTAVKAIPCNRDGEVPPELEALLSTFSAY